MANPSQSGPRRYDVRLVNIDGAQRTVRVITGGGEHKAAYLAGSTIRAALGRAPFIVDVVEMGPVELHENGDALLDGSVFDRQEW